MMESAVMRLEELYINSVKLFIEQAIGFTMIQIPKMPGPCGANQIRNICAIEVNPPSAVLSILVKDLLLYPDYSTGAHSGL